MLSSSSAQGDQTSGTFNGAQIYFCHTSRTTLSTTFDTNYDGNTPTLMLDQPALTFNWTAGAWNEIPLSNTFAYNGTNNLLIEIRWNSSGSSMLAAASSLAQNCILGATVDATTGSYYYRMCMRVHYVPTTPFVTHENTQVNAGDGLVDPGESIQLICSLKNNGTTATNLQATLSSTSGYCSITQPNWSAGNVAKGVTVSNSATPYAVNISAGAPLGTSLPFKMTVSAGGGYTTNLSFNVSVAKPQLSLAGFVVNDLSGNADLALSPNERVQLLVAITNAGTSATGVVATLSCSNTKVSLASSSSSYGTISKLSSSSNVNEPFCIQMASDAWTAGSYPFTLNVSYNGSSTTSFTFMVAGDYASPATGSSSWIDTTGGTTLTIADEGGVYTNLPFSFPYYGQSYTQIGIVGNGYLDIPAAQIGYNNVAIPNPGEPNGIIAPYWDDLDPGAGGTIRGITVGTAPNRIFVVEWNGVPRYGVASSCTFEVLLHESGKIVFQYGAMSGTSVYGASATIGIESPDGSQGVQYSYNLAGAVANGTSITFDTTKPPTDNDSDGIPNALEAIYGGTTTSIVPNSDSDGDGQINSSEIYAGTNPNDPSSLLQLEGTQQLTTNSCVLVWQSVPGRYYDIYKAASPSGTWSKVNGSPCVGATGSTQYTVDTSAGTRAYWRIAAP